MKYRMNIAGLDRDLPLCKVSDDLYIGAFVMFGDAEITVVWVYVSYLRKKLAALHADIQIKAHRNAGYSLEEAP